MPNLIRPALVSALVVIAAACTSGGAGPSSGPPSNAPSGAPSGAPSPSSGIFGEIDHATGATDVLLRYEEGGGFMMPAFIATQAPIFTLYGDGTIIFRNPMAETPPAVGSVMPQNPFRTAKLSEEQIQEVLKFALGDGGLGVARANYENMMIADAGTAIFTVDAGGIKKAVSVYALGLEMEGMPDALARAAFKNLAERLGRLRQRRRDPDRRVRPRALPRHPDGRRRRAGPEAVAVGGHQAGRLPVPGRSERLPDGRSAR